MNCPATQNDGSAHSRNSSFCAEPADANGTARDTDATPDSSFVFSLSLTATAFTQSQLIDPAAPQAALAGRSNVGKSSLVNALAGRKALAKVSAIPGKTRSINYYRLGTANGYLVDLPGYGYAKCSQEERNKWAELIDYYLRNTSGLRVLILLLDARLQPQKADKDLAAFASALSLPVFPVLTKADKCSKKDAQACAHAWGGILGQRNILVTSSGDKTGICSLQGYIRHTLS